MSTEDKSVVDETQAQEDKDWDEAMDDYKDENKIEDKPTDPDKKDEDKPKGDEADKPKLTDQEIADAEAKEKADKEEAEKAKNETPEQTEARHKKEAEDAAAADKPDEGKPDSSQQEVAPPSRQEIIADQKALKDDIRKEMFSDTPTRLEDSEGNHIRTIADVQQFLNPDTGKPFTEEEAGSYLLKAQQALDKNLKEQEDRIEEIAETNLTLKEQTESVKREYGELLKHMPRLAQRLWLQYEKTLVIDEKSNIVTKAPVSLEDYYKTILAPYKKYAELLEKQNKEAGEKPEGTEGETEEEKKKKKEEAEKAKKAEMSDREDITSTGKGGSTDKEEAEWKEVAKEHYEG